MSNEGANIESNSNFFPFINYLVIKFLHQLSYIPLIATWMSFYEAKETR